MTYQISCFCGHRFFITDEQLSAPVTCPACKRQLLPVITHPDAPADSARADSAPPPDNTATPKIAADPLPNADSPAATPPASAEPTKRCPFCGEVILAVARKCKHCGEFLDRHVAPDGPLANGTAAAGPSPHADAPPVFSLSVSQWDNFWKFLICLTLFAIAAGVLILVPTLRQYAPLGIPIAFVSLSLVACFFYLSARNARCYVRPTRIETETGILSKDINTLEIFRITDLELKQSLLERILRIGTIRIMSSDPKTPELVLYQIPKARRVYQYLQDQIPIAARQRGAGVFIR